jgi:NAD+ diphosphatase
VLTSGLAFAGEVPDRDAALRSDPGALAAALAQGAVLPIWRGKPLTRDGGGGLGWLAAGHPALAPGEPPIYLGRSGGMARFAQDISVWVPPAGEAPVETGFLDVSVQRHPDLPPGHGFAELRGLMAHLAPDEGALAATAKALTGWHASHRFCAACGVPSQPERGGWQRRCAACGAAHFPRTDPVVIMLVLHGNCALIGRSAGWPPGMYSCLAGFIEPGETVEAAVRREVLEEAGIRIGRVRYLASQPWPFPASLMMGCVAEAESLEITLDPEELEAARWIGREEMAEVMAGTHRELRAPRPGAIAGALLAAWLADRLD